MAAPLLEQSIDIAATPAAVWAVISDLRRMGDWSPQCRKVMVLGGGTVALGTTTVNVNKNRSHPWVWLTTAKVIEYQQDRRIAYRIRVNGSVWSFTIAPTETGVRLTERREAPNNTKKVSQVAISTVMGGEKSFDDETVGGMRQTLARIAAELA